MVNAGPDGVLSLTGGTAQILFINEQNLATRDANLNGTAVVLAAVSASRANTSADCSVSDSVQVTTDSESGFY